MTGGNKPCHITPPPIKALVPLKVYPTSNPVLNLILKTIQNFMLIYPILILTSSSLPKFGNDIVQCLYESSKN